LHQHQRPVKRASVDGRPVEYVEVELGDIETANRLAHEVLGRSLDELPPQTRRLLRLLDELVSAECERLEMERSHFRFTRREVRESTGWTYDQVRIHLARLVALEYVLVHQGGRGQSFVYELLYEGGGEEGAPILPGLIDVGKLRGEGTTRSLGGSEATLEGESPKFGAPLAPHLTPIGGGLGSELSPLAAETSAGNQPSSPETAHWEAKEGGASHRKSGRRTDLGPTSGLGLALEAR
jgi:hypothetical protein